MNQRLPAGAPHGDAVSPSTSRLPSATGQSPKPGAQFQPTPFVRRVIDSHSPDELNRTNYIGQSDAPGPSPSIHRAAGFSAPPTPAPMHFAPIQRHIIPQQQPNAPVEQSGPAQPAQLQHPTQTPPLPPYPTDHTHAQPTKAFDRLAFRAVSQTFNDLKERGILLISDDSAQRDVPFQLSPSVAKFFMTDAQVEQYAHQDPGTWPGLAHSEATRQGHHVQLGGRVEEPAHAQHQAQAMHSEDFTPRDIPHTVFPRTEAQADDKIRMMLKFLVKYTNHGLTGPWIKKFFSRSLQTEARELRTMLDTEHLVRDMEQYWAVLQKRRYSTHFRWVYNLAPVNLRMWSRKQSYKLQWPNRYLRQKALWQAASLGGEIPEIVHKMYPIFPARGWVPVVQVQAGQETVEAERVAEVENTETSFADWIQTSAANLSVTISYAWNELREDGVLHKDAMDLAPHEAELLTALRNLDAAIKDYGVNGAEIGQDGALEYAKVVLRFTQGLHDYLELKEHAAETAPEAFAFSGGEMASLGPGENAPGETEEPTAMEPAMPQAPREPTMRIQLRKEQELESEEDSLATNAERDQLSTDLGTESEMEHTKRALSTEQDRQLRREEPQESLLSDETRARLLRSARLDFYEKHRSPSLSPLRQTRPGQAPLHTESVFEDDQQYVPDHAGTAKMAAREEQMSAQSPEGYDLNLQLPNMKTGKQQTTPHPSTPYEGHGHEQHFLHPTETADRHIVI